jgi:glycerophosphoryl diester phosphodiesterase
MGADYLEQDLVASRDGSLVVLHDLHLDDVSDVASRFLGRSRDDGRHYVVDFDLDELRELRLRERRAPGAGAARYPGRFSGTPDGLRVVTFDEELELIASLNRTTGRRVGVYPEIKAPGWHAALGIDVTRLAVESLRRHGYDAPDANAYLQCFERRALLQAADELGCTTPKVLLLDSAAVDEIDGEQDGWERVRTFAVGIGLPFARLFKLDANGRPAPAALVARVRSTGLQIHPFTLRQDEIAAPGFDETLRFLMQVVGVEAVFCDQPDAALTVRAGI